jgi:O-antigen/teichoic acid export membrane protein
MSGMREAGEDVSDIAEKTMLAAPVLLIPMLLITIFNSEYILRVMYSPEYVAAKWYLILLVVVEIFQGYRLQFESVFNSYDKPRATTKTSLLSVIVNIITAPFLVFQFGGLGVIYSTLLSEVVRIVAYEIQVNSLMGEYIMPKSVYLQYLCGAFICGVITGLDKLLISSNLVLFGVTLVLSTVGLYAIQYAIIDDFRVIIDSVLD